MAPTLALQNSAAPLPRPPLSHASREHAARPLAPTPVKPPPNKLVAMPPHAPAPENITSRLARAWSSASAPLRPLPPASEINSQLTSDRLPPPVAARLITTVALNNPGSDYVSQLSDSFAHLDVWPSVVAAAVFPTSLFPSPNPLSASPDIYSTASSKLSSCTISTESLSPTLSTTTPLEQIQLGLSEAGTSRIPRTVHYSLAPGETAELDYEVTLGLKRQSKASRQNPRTVTRRPAKRLVPSPNIDPLATVPLGRRNSGLGSPNFSRRRASSTLPNAAPSRKRSVMSPVPTHLANSLDRFDDTNEVAAAVGASTLKEAGHNPSDDLDPVDEVQQALRDVTQHIEQYEDTLQPMEMDLPPVSPQVTNRQHAPELPQRENQSTEQNNEAKNEAVIVVEDVRNGDASDDEVMEVKPDGDVTPVKPLGDKKKHDMNDFLLRLRNLKRQEGRKHAHVVSIDNDSSELPQAPDTAFARQEKIREKQEKDRKHADNAKEKRRQQAAREHDKKKKAAKRKKKIAAKSRGEVYVSSEEDDEKGTEDQSTQVQDVDKGPIAVDNEMHPVSESRAGTQDVDPSLRQSHKRQRLNSPGSTHYGGGSGPQHPWSGDRAPPNGSRPYGAQPYRPPGPAQPPRYPGDRFHSPPYYPQHPLHSGAPYPPPGHGNMQYAPHPQYPPHDSPYGAPGYHPHGQPAPPMYHANPPPYNPYGQHAQGPPPPHPYYPERERLPRRRFNEKRDELYRSVGQEFEHLTTADGKEIDDFLDNQLYMFRPDETEKDYVLQRGPGKVTILRIRKKDGVWSVVRLRD